MESKRKFYKTTLTVTVLTADERYDTPLDLKTVAQDIVQEHAMGDFIEKDCKVISGKEMAENVRAISGDPEFFGINDAGEDVEQ